jgi:hypothetical protein
VSSSLFFATRAEAQAYLDNCQAGSNYMAESYHDRVNAERTLRYFDGWTPTPLPRPSRADAPIPTKRLAREKRKQHR